MSDALDAKVAARRQAEMVANLRRLSKPGAQQRRPRTASRRSGATSTAAAGEEFCDLCGKPLDPDHRHLLHLVDRRILCTCESCLAMRGGDAELRPTGTRFVWLDDFDMSDEAWASFGVPIGLAFFIDSSVTGSVAALYPSPAGATESEIDAENWRGAADREPGPDGARVRRRGPARQPDGRRAPVRDRADRRVLPARRPGQGELGGDLGRHRPRARDRRVLRRDQGEVVGGRHDE